jgi:hypothetical protein
MYIFAILCGIELHLERREGAMLYSLNALATSQEKEDT